jgi:hypothetical protein
MGLAIEDQRTKLGDHYGETVKWNHDFANARRKEENQAATDVSEFVKFDLLARARLAKFMPELLDPTNPNAITNEVVRQHVTATGDLLPAHAGDVLSAINEAIAYQSQEDSSKRQAERDGFKLLERTFVIPQKLDPDQAFTLKRLEQDAYAQLAAEYTANPKSDRNELALNLSAKYTARVLAVQEANAEQLDEELLSMEKSFPKGMANEKHQLSEGPRKKLEEQSPILRGLFKLYDAKVDRWNQLVEQGQLKASEKNAKPR